MPDMIVASTTASQEEMDHAVSANWREPFPAKTAEVTTGTQPETAAAEVTHPETPATPEEVLEVETDPASEPADVQETTELRPKGKGGFQKRIDKLTERNTDLATQLAEYRERAEAAEKRLAKPAETETPAKPETSASAKDKPTPDQIGAKYKDYEEYNEALISWKAADLLEKTLAERDKTAREYEERLEREDIQEGYKKTASEFVKKHPDFNEVVSNASAAGMQLPEPIANAILELENGPAVTYFLCQNPEVALGLIGLSAKQGFVELGRLSASLEEKSSAPAPKAPAKKPISTAPPPARPVGGHSARSSVPLSEVTDTDAFIARRNREESERERTRRY